jgi:hypothetical protein
MNNIITVAIASLLVILVIPALAQEKGQEKIMIDVHCLDCPNGYEYLIKVFEPMPTDNPKLVGEKKFTSKDLTEITANDSIYLDKKFMGKKLVFDLINLTSGLSSSKTVYIVDEVQGIEVYSPDISRSEPQPQPQPQPKQECFTSPDGREKYCGYVNE